MYEPEVYVDRIVDAVRQACVLALDQATVYQSADGVDCAAVMLRALRWCAESVDGGFLRAAWLCLSPHIWALWPLGPKFGREMVILKWGA